MEETHIIHTVKGLHIFSNVTVDRLHILCSINIERTTDSTNNRIYSQVQKKLERTCWEDSRKKHLKISTKSRKFGKTTGVMEEFCFIICITDLNRQTIRKSNNDVMFPNEGNILLLTSYSSIIIFSSFFSVLTSTSVHWSG